jgi:signal transduction histidine kinase
MTGLSHRSALLSVRDDGPGVPPNETQRIFERFAQLSEARTPGRGSAGLGLAIVAAIVENRGGRVEAEAPASGGLLVTVRLPLA